MHGKQYKPLSVFMKDRSDQAIRIKMQKIIRDHTGGVQMDAVLTQIATLSLRKAQMEGGSSSQNMNGVLF